MQPYRFIVYCHKGSRAENFCWHNLEHNDSMRATSVMLAFFQWMGMVLHMHDYSLCIWLCMVSLVTGIGWLACLLAQRVKGHHPALWARIVVMLKCSHFYIVDLTVYTTSLASWVFLHVSPYTYTAECHLSSLHIHCVHTYFNDVHYSELSPIHAEICKAQIPIKMCWVFRIS